MLRVLVVIVFFISFAALFKKAANGLNPTRINAVSLAFYLLLFFQAIGASIIYLGFRDHYLVQKISSEQVFDSTYYCLIYAFITMPLVIILVNRRHAKVSTRVVNKNDVNIYKDVEPYYGIILFLTLISAAAGIYTFYKIGYVSIFKILFSGGGFDFATARTSNNRGFSGNQYIRNLLFLNLSPILSSASYVFYKASDLAKWKVLFWANLVVTVLAKTYDFSKAPLIVFFISLYIINGFFEQDREKAFKRLVIIISIVVGLIVFSYAVVAKYSGQKWISLSHGPISRIVITQVATLFLHFDLFPAKHPFLYGKSMAAWIGSIIGDPNWGLRSGRIVMEHYSPAAVSNGTAGVMNTVFLGEAYANWGYVGVLVSPIIVGLWFGNIQNYIDKSEKSPMNLIVYMTLLNFFTTSLEGGFAEFIFSSTLIFNLLILLIIHICGNNFKIVIKRRNYNSM